MPPFKIPLRLLTPPDGESAERLAPIRADVLGTDRLQEYARALAQQDQIATTPLRSHRLFNRLADNRKVLAVAQQRFGEVARASKPLSPAAEWLLDNYYVVQEQLREIEQNLSHGYYHELPKLANGEYAGYPRVYGIALKLIAHTDSRLDGDLITRFVQAYQTVTPLSSGELWAVAIMLRLGLVENLRRLVEQSLATQEQREDAEQWAAEFLSTSKRAASDALLGVGDLANKDGALDAGYIVNLLQHLRDEDPSVAPVMHWLEQRLSDLHTTVDDVLRAEHLRRASNRLSVSNVITSMRVLSIVDWATFFETTSPIERTLRADPAGVYARMEFATRDQYRHAVERISKGAGIRTARAEREREIAQAAVTLARDWQESHPDLASDAREAHVGYYLIARGVTQLETTIGYHSTPRERVARWILHHATLFYLGMAALFTLFFLLGAILYIDSVNVSLVWTVVVIVLTAIPAMDNALSLLNWTITTEVEPQPLPKLEFTGDLAADYRTMVVVPALISDASGVERLFDALEVRYLANRDPYLHFALLGDFADSSEQHRPEDETLINQATARVNQLNARYGAERFYYFHRQRTWNESEQMWMGWERKRGKLLEFNRLLRSATDTNYGVCVGDPTLLPQIKFVITLDADTELPINAAKRLIGTLAHPLNRPVFDAASGRVLDGYSIIQPRTAVTAVAANETRFAQIFAGDTGLDPYSAASSDVYQDLFGAGIYVGKAIYDVDVVEKVLAHRFPQNTLLSHDLLEGTYARAGLATDIQLLEDYPTGVDAFTQRQHRWIRGDWQITDWLFPRVRDESGRRARNPLPLIERWKIFDNLRRSLAPPSIFALLAAGWLVLPGLPLVWTALALFPLVFPQFIAFASGIAEHPKGETWRAYLLAIREQLLLSAARALLYIAFVLYSAVLGLDAIVRVVVRRIITHRHLLQWTSAAIAERGQARTIGDYGLRMWSAPLLSSLLLLIVLFAHPSAFVVAWPVLSLWWFSPLLAFYISQPLATFVSDLPADARSELRITARKIWRFYDTFAGAYDHYLPPDNYQEEPVPVVAHRTSPTNIGFLLLSTLAAYDFGHLGVTELVERLERTFDTLDQLEKYRGHLYNWYDTSSLHPLMPRYVSTVDSGNLAASLYALKQACSEMEAAPIVAPAQVAGLLDTIGALRESLEKLQTQSPDSSTRALHPAGQAGVGQAVASVCEQMNDATREHVERLRAAPDGAREWLDLLDALGTSCSRLSTQQAELERTVDRNNVASVRYWCESLTRETQAQRDAITTFMPWTNDSAEFQALSPESVSDEHSALSTQHSALRAGLNRIPSLNALSQGCTVSAELTAFESALDAASLYDDERRRWRDWLRTLRAQLKQAQQAAKLLCERYREIAQRADELAAGMDFKFLFDEQREIFSIGYNLSTQQCDNSFYDLLASEARLASFVAIAQSQVPARHWFKLSRPMTHAAGRLALLSWGGTMFEYLMPPLLMRSYERTMLQETQHAIVRRHIQYGTERHVPWGISESGFYAFDYQQNYQYRLFGVPDLGLRRESSDNLVIAPYATFLALAVAPNEAWQNLQHLKQAGGANGYGYYEALDFTPSRKPKNLHAGIVRSFMAHHQGMSLVALDNVLNGDPMRRRFHAEPLMSAAELLLQEKLPRHAPIIEPHPEEGERERDERRLRHEAETGAAARPFTTAHTRTPRAHLLSNGTYTVMLTNAGGGYSACADTAITRWREDVTRDDWGAFIYIQDAQSGACWSAAYQPMGVEPDKYEVRFLQDRAEYQRRDDAIETTLAVAVSPERNIEVRRLTLRNQHSSARELTITSYAEVVLDKQTTDAAHPAFSKLFVESEFIAQRSALLFKRRPRAQEQPTPWAIHLLNTGADTPPSLEYETDRARFIGRGRTPRDADALNAKLSNTLGATLDPIMSLRTTVRIEAGAQVTLSFVTGYADSREQAQSLADEYCDTRAVERVFDLVATYSDIRLRHLGITGEEGHLFQRFAARVLYPEPALRATSDVLARNTRGQSGLWAYGISGDYPLALVQVDDQGELALVRQALLAHQFWQMHHFNVDLVILNTRATSYNDGLHDAIQSMIDMSLSRPWLDKPGGVFVRRGDHIPDEDKVLLQTVARVILDGDFGSLADQLDRSPRLTPADKLRIAPRRRLPTASVAAARNHPTRVADGGRPTAIQPSTVRRPPSFFNGIGGFDLDAREYVITLDAGQWTPTPWINVIANAQFGCLVSESGLGYTWALNSQQNRLTPWGNDPLSDRPREIIYLRDDATGEQWSPTALPIREVEPYEVRHGAGYSRFTHRSHGIAQELLVCVPRDEPIKLMRLTLRNESNEARTLSATYFCEWVLGVQRESNQHYIVTDFELGSAALFARNTYNTDFAGRIAFAASSETPVGATADRTEFIGRNGALDSPAALERGRLAEHFGANMDPCAALQVKVQLGPNTEKEIVFMLGQSKDHDQARALIRKYREVAQTQLALDAVKQFWNDALTAVHVQTPDESMNVMLNQWLLYQVLACRVWGRSALYQSGGAYGYRDQLQDVLALLWSAPQLAREQILRAAAHQFVEGDAQHWWHPPTGAGVRTQFSDDYLWLPFVAQHYIVTTGDAQLLDERAEFITAPSLDASQHEMFSQPQPSGESASVYEHCTRAIDRALGRFGAHGLPLMGIGDWNDGMNRIGSEGKGESVWVGWFLFDLLLKFADMAQARDDVEHAHTYRSRAEQLKRALNEQAWDGAWYRRAYFDDGTPLGSKENDECQIDSIAQTWAIISGAGDDDKSTQAMQAVEQHLIDDAQRIIRLLTPPFDAGKLDPGYIKGYPPGIRENGAQYTHAATWVVLAYALRGDGERAMQLWHMLNPINHTLTAEDVARYKVEPYVLVADVYSHPQHVGRGGWTWYTGSASWLYRIALEHMLGMQRRGDTLSIAPCIPREWKQYQITYRVGTTTYAITVENPNGVNRGVARIEVDGDAVEAIRLRDDGATHRVTVVMGRTPADSSAGYRNDAR